MIKTLSNSDPEVPPNGVTGSGAPASFDASDCLLQKIRSALDAPKASMISGSTGRVLIDPKSRTYCEAIPDRAAFFRTPSQQVETTYHTPGPGGTWRPVAELLWESAYHGPKGALLAPHRPLKAVRLLRWPNLTRVSHTPAMISICALLHKRPLSMAVAIRTLHVPEEDAWRFFSAALASGVARQIGEVAMQSTSGAAVQSRASRRVTSFWSQLFSKLSGG
ncbi:MAG: hypothetical protein ACPGJE_04220 [Wenzhouxiangellaceae bacterium]